jgi:hypothetical protein
MTDIKKAIDKIIANRERYQVAEAYYEGINDEVFQNQRWYRLFRYEKNRFNTFTPFRFNFSKTVVDAVLNRLEVEQVETTTPQGDEFINNVWNQTDLKLDMNEIHKNTLVYGDAYAIIWPDMQGQLAIDYNSPVNTVVIYDEENPRLKSYAAKLWQITDSTDRKVIRLNMYYADRIEKYEALGDLDFINGVPNVQLIETVVNPWGEIPVFHFRTSKPFGRPEHADAFGPQDAINKLISTHMYTVDYQGAPQRYALANGGNAAEMDDFSEDDTARENIGSLQNGPGQLWYLQGVSALFKKVLNRQLALGSTWRDLFKFMLRVEGINAEIDIDWKSPESIDSLDQWDIAVRKRSVGLPVKQILLELGYDPEIAQLIEDASSAQQEVGLPGTGLNTNNMALQQAAAEEDQSQGA